MRLNLVSTIQLGFTVRGRLTVDPAGVTCIQLRDVDPDHGVDPTGLQRFKLDDVQSRYLVGPGDILFRSRGERTTALALDGHFGDPAVAILPLFILRPDPIRVAPDYLAWALNQAPAQRHFETTAQGQTLRMVSRASLDSLEIAVPDLATQHRIVACDALAAREQELTRRTAELRRRRNAMILAELAGESRPEGASRENM